MREPITLPRAPSEETKRLNPHLYAKKETPLRGKMPTSFEAIGKEGPLEGKFVALWERLDPGGDCPFVREHRFSGHRRFKFDFAWRAIRVALETDGGIFSRGRHNRAGGFARDCEKTNLAALEGWTVFRLCTGQVVLENVRPIYEFIRERCLNSSKE